MQTMAEYLEHFRAQRRATRKLVAAVPEQHFAFHLGIVAGVGFPQPGINLTVHPDTDRLPVLLPIYSVCEFPMGVVVTGYATRTSDPVHPLALGIDGFEIVDLQPAGLECLIESYVKMELGSVIFPQILTLLRRILPDLVVQIAIPHKPDSPITLPGAVRMTLTPVSGRFPHNPAFQNDTLETYVQLVEVVP